MKIFSLFKLMGLLGLFLFMLNPRAVAQVYTFDQCEGGTISVSSFWDGKPGDNAFDQDDFTCWVSMPGNEQDWISYDFGEDNLKTIIKYTINCSPNAPAGFVFEASNDNENWTLLDEQTEQVFSACWYTVEYPVSNETAFRYYRLRITDKGSSSFSQIYEMEMMEEAVFTGAGLGSEEAPYEITNSEQLYQVHYFPGKHYRLMNDLDMSSTAENNESADGWDPIGSKEAPFKGTFDGNGHVISNLFINKPSTDHVGLFGYVNEGTILTLGIKDANITGHQYCGILSGTSTDFSQFLACFTTGSVSGSRTVGGIIGHNLTSKICNCYNRASVTATGYGDVGGLIGEIGNAGQIEQSYNIGEVIGSNNTGGLVGYKKINGGSINSFWDMETSGQTTSDCYRDKGLTTSEMKDLRNYLNINNSYLYNAWDFVTDPMYDDKSDDYWDFDFTGVINDGYPYLSWENGDSKSLVSPPDRQAKNIRIDGAVEALQISWDNGNGAKRVVFVSGSTNYLAKLFDLFSYQANSEYGKGDMDEYDRMYCVYNGAGNSVTVTGLEPDREYRILVCEYCGEEGRERYQTNMNSEEWQNPLVFTTPKIIQTIDFPEFGEVRYGNPDILLTNTTSSGNYVFYSSSNEEVAKIENSTLKILSVGNAVISASCSESFQCYGISQSRTINVLKAQTLQELVPVTNVLPQGKSLSYLSFSGGKVTGNGAEINGSYVFDNPDLIPGLGSENYQVTFVPVESQLYESVSFLVEVVTKADFDEDGIIDEIDNDDDDDGVLDEDDPDPLNPDIHTSVDEKSLNKMILYPNPAGDVVYLKNVERGTVRVRVINMAGSVVMDKLMNNRCLMVTGLPRGIYFLMINDQWLRFVKE